jgi:hypothetical protein
LLNRGLDTLSQDIASPRRLPSAQGSSEEVKDGVGSTPAPTTGAAAPQEVAPEAVEPMRAPEEVEEKEAGGGDHEGPGDNGTSHGASEQAAPGARDEEKPPEVVEDAPAPSPPLAPPPLPQAVEPTVPLVSENFI